MKELRIVKLVDRNTLVGWFEFGEEFHSLEDAYVLRRYGTTKGLPQLSEEGPQKDTDLQKVYGGICQIPAKTQALIVTFPCNEGTWTKYFKKR